MTKLLFLINTLRDGGAEKILVDLVNHLNPNQFDIEVKLIYKHGVYLDKLNKNIKTTFISGKPKTFWSTQISRLLPRLSSKILHKLFIRKKYDIEIAFLEGYATKIIAGAPNGVKKLAWVHCDLTKTEWITGVFKNENGFINCYKKIDEVICVSESVKNAFIQRFGNISKLSVKYNPVDEIKIQKLSNEKIDNPIKKDCFTIISSGRMVYPKNFSRLLRAINHIQKQGYKLQLWLLGDGEERDSLENYVKENNLRDTIFFIGFQKNPFPYIKNSDLYVCSSIYEGFSTAVTEALILGTPVLTTDVAGMRELLGNNEYGIITENSDDAFEKGIQNILDNPEQYRYYKRKALERSSFFKFDDRLNAITELLHKS